jgi:hypothetical protein
MTFSCSVSCQLRESQQGHFTGERQRLICGLPRCATHISELLEKIKSDQRTASVPIVKVFDSSVDDAPHSPEVESYLLHQLEAEHFGQAVSRALGKSVGEAYSKTTRWSHNGEQVMK